MDVVDYIRSRKLLVDEALSRLLASSGRKAAGLHQAIRYAIMSDGKRIRPILTLATAEMLGRRPASVLYAAAAMEMVHTCSLILDDLPCMDDGRTRRHRPSLYKAYGESTAILAAEALLMRAFALLAENARRARVTKAVACQLQYLVSQAGGHDGLITGQYMDLTLDHHRARQASLTDIYRRKTAALFVASVQVACLLCGATGAITECVSAYAGNLGVAFQIIDDLLDAVPGADTGKRSAKLHPSYPRVFGLEASAEAARSFIRKAVRALSPLGSQAEKLRGIAALVGQRIP